MKKIAILISSLSSGGAERVVSVIANSLSSSFLIEIVTTTDGEDFYELHQCVKRVRLNCEGKYAHASIALINQISKTVVYLREARPDVVISFIHEQNVVSVISSKLARVPIIISERSNPEKDGINPFFKCLRRTLYPFSDMLITPTKGIDSFFERFVLSARRMVIPNPIPGEFMDQDVNTDRRNLIVFMGRFAPVKRIDWVVKSIALNKRLLEEHGWCVEFYGRASDSQLEEFNGWVSDHQLKELVTYKGTHRSPEKVLVNSKILLLASAHESYGNVIAEAMAVGCVPISIDCDFGPREIISDSIDGYLVDDNVNALADKLSDLVTNQELLTQMSFEAIKIKEIKSVSTISLMWESAIHKVIDRL